MGIAATENQAFLVRDLNSHENLGMFKTNITLTEIPAHGSRALKFLSLNAENPNTLEDEIRKFLQE